MKKSWKVIATIQRILLLPMVCSGRLQVTVLEWMLPRIPACRQRMQYGMPVPKLKAQYCFYASVFAVFQIRKTGVYGYW